MSANHTVRLNVNGVDRVVDVPPRRLLVDVLRHDLRLTGTHVGCEQGVCGACTVIVDGAVARACLVFAVQLDGSIIETVEGLADDGALSDIQTTFGEKAALQCGFCTTGFLMLARSFLQRETAPSDEEIREVVSSNLCRCTGYQSLNEAFRELVDRQDCGETLRCGLEGRCSRD
jgi:aerobic-type carbon monoxide dehydrogenase small subunit (CoxS/CutS family)